MASIDDNVYFVNRGKNSEIQGLLAQITTSGSRSGTELVYDKAHMSVFQAIILAIIEGITEFLPISSTAHLLLTGKLIGLASTGFIKTFDIAIQFGAILAVVALYWRQLLDRAIQMRLLAAFLPTMFLGALLYSFVKNVLFENIWLILGALFFGGIVLIILEWLHREPEDAHSELPSIPLPTCFAIGIFQSIAMVPGVSRAAATIAGGLLLGLRRKTIVEFSFLLAVPTMAAATALDLFKGGFMFSVQETSMLLIGGVVTFITALTVIKFLLRYIVNHTFIPFAVYRMALAVLFALSIL